VSTDGSESEEREEREDERLLPAEENTSEPLSWKELSEEAELEEGEKLLELRAALFRVILRALPLWRLGRWLFAPVALLAALPAAPLLPTGFFVPAVPRVVTLETRETWEAWEAFVARLAIGFSGFAGAPAAWEDRRGPEAPETRFAGIACRVCCRVLYGVG